MWYGEGCAADIMVSGVIVCVVLEVAVAVAVVVSPMVAKHVSVDVNSMYSLLRS